MNYSRKNNIITYKKHISIQLRVILKSLLIVIFGSIALCSCSGKFDLSVGHPKTTDNSLESGYVIENSDVDILNNGNPCREGFHLLIKNNHLMCGSGSNPRYIYNPCPDGSFMEKKNNLMVCIADSNVCPNGFDASFDSNRVVCLPNN